MSPVAGFRGWLCCSSAVIWLARAKDLPRLREVERAAGEALWNLGRAAVAEDESASLDELAAYQRAGRRG